METSVHIITDKNGISVFLLLRFVLGDFDDGTFFDYFCEANILQLLMEVLKNSDKEKWQKRSETISER